MRCENVRVVDSTGRSYRPGPKSLADAARLQKLRQAERHLKGEIRAALAYIDDLAVGVRLVVEGDSVRCAAASVSLPRSYLVRVCRARHGRRGEPDGEALRACIDEQLGKVRQIVAGVTGAAAEGAVVADWYYDAPAPVVASPGGGPAGPAAPAPGWLERNAAAAAAGGLGVLLGMLAAAKLLGMRRARLRRRVAAAGGEAGGGSEGQAPFAALRHLGGARLLALLREEHPQTIALVLAHVPPSAAAKVLAALAEQTQVDVTRRIAALESIDESVVREVERAVAERLAEGEAPPETPGGVEAAADILGRAGYHTEQSVLNALADAQPSLAQDIRRRIFAFDDIARLPASWLQPALRGVDNPQLAVALRAADGEVRKKVLSCLPASSRRRLREEMARLGPVLLSEVEAAQERLIEAVRQVGGGQYVGEPARLERELLA
jgi:flagellar motor switch protein FliG